MTAEKLFTKLEERRNELGIDIISFCQLIGFGKTAYYNWRRGDTPKGVEDTLKVINFLKLLEEEDWNDIS